MTSLFSPPSLWHQILVWIVAAPFVCLFLGLLVCFGDSSAWRMFDGAKWYQVPIGLMMLGAFVAVVLALVAVVTVVLWGAINFIFHSNWSIAVAFILALIVVLGGIGWAGESWAAKENLKRDKRLDAKMNEEPRDGNSP